MMKHQKHAKLIKSFDGIYGTNEWGILGSNCGEIKKLAQQISTHFSNEFSFVYLDADHGDKSEQIFPFGAESTIYQDFFEYKNFSEKNAFDILNYHQDADITLINSNHFDSKRQIVIVDSAKEASLKRKLNRLTQIDVILLKDIDAPFDFLEPYIQESTQILSLENTASLMDILKAKFEETKPALFGLVLAGGKSQRMGQDKTQLNYHGKAQKDYLFELISQYCDESFLSVQKSTNSAHEIEDKFLGLGVLSGILSALQFNPRVAWLVVAVDMPNVNEAVISQLVQARNPQKTATAFHNPDTNFPDPLLTIYEPKSYQRLLSFLGLGYSCPRKMLINSDCEVIPNKNSDLLLNVNTPEQFEYYQKSKS